MPRQAAHRATISWRPRVLAAPAIAALALLFLVLARRGNRARSLRDVIRRSNRRWFNPIVLRFAGNGPWPVARLEHRGRLTGALRATPLLAWPMRGGFIVPMPYGTDVDWAKNLLHAGEGVLQHQRVRYHVGDPRIGSLDAIAREFPPLIAAIASRSGIHHVMRVDVLPNLMSRESSAS